MSRQKKTRKPGPLAARKASGYQESADAAKARKKAKKRKGLQPGSRHGDASGHQTAMSGGRQQGDPRLGSTKPVPLALTPTTAPTPKPAASARPTGAVNSPRSSLPPEQELERLEQDERLNRLLDRVDAGESLPRADQRWLDACLARHHELMVLLGLEEAPGADRGDEALLERFINQEWQEPWPEDDNAGGHR